MDVWGGRTIQVIRLVNALHWECMVADSGSAVQERKIIQVKPMSNPFFDHLILNSPYNCPQRHWDLDTDGQHTQQVVENSRRAEFIAPIPKPWKRMKILAKEEMVFDEGKDLSASLPPAVRHPPIPSQAIHFELQGTPP